MYNNVTVEGVLPKRIHLNLRLPPFISRISATNNNSSRKSPQKLLFPCMIILYVCFVCIMSLQKWFPGQSWRSEKTQNTFKREKQKVAGNYLQFGGINHTQFIGDGWIGPCVTLVLPTGAGSVGFWHRSAQKPHNEDLIMSMCNHVAFSVTKSTYWKIPFTFCQIIV